MPSLYFIKARGIRCLKGISLLAFSSFAHAGMIDKDGMQAWEICGMCHNADGISRMAKFPKLAGQKAAYLEQQINNFRAGLRHNDGGQMQSIVGEVAQEDVAKIAAYFSGLPPDSELDVEGSQKIAAESETDSELKSAKPGLGESLFKVGREGVTACAGCHAVKASKAPWLDRQHQQYLEKQMTDFISGDRDSVCFVSHQNGGQQQESAASKSAWLENSEIEALAIYLSTLTLERDQ